MRKIKVDNVRELVGVGETVPGMVKVGFAKEMAFELRPWSRMMKRNHQVKHKYI